MKYTGIAYRLPRFLRRHILCFETDIEDAVGAFAAAQKAGSRVLDAGAGEGQYAHYFVSHRYCGVDLAVGDAAWDYARLDAVADLIALPFRADAFDAAIHIVTIEHLREPGRALAEIGRAIKPGGYLLVAAPHEWEVHQAPHDYFRYTRYGLAYLLDAAGYSSLRRLFPSSGAAAAKRITILLRGHSLAVLHSGRNPRSPTGADPAVPRLSRPGP
jgi:SAM-dependent methyltransferase